MSEQQPLINSVDDSLNLARTIEEKPDEHTASSGNDLKQPVTSESSELGTKKKSFQITSIRLDHDVEKPNEDYAKDLQHDSQNLTVSVQNIASKSDANVQPKKKISFQVTSIESKEGRRRGDSSGYDDMDELNESEFLEEEGGGTDSSLLDASGNGNGTSRFKVVKIPRYDSKPYNRGRWKCSDFVVPTPSAKELLRVFSLDVNEKSDQDSAVSGQTSMVSNVYSGPLFKGISSNVELHAIEGSEQQNIACTTQIHDEKNLVVKSDFIGNPGPSSPRVDERSDFVINNSSGLGKSAESGLIQSVRPLADEGILR